MFFLFNIEKSRCLVLKNMELTDTKKMLWKLTRKYAWLSSNLEKQQLAGLKPVWYFPLNKVFAVVPLSFFYYRAIVFTSCNNH